jgi:hypothetical protein
MVRHPAGQPARKRTGLLSMRAEIETIIDEIKQGITLLRRHL